MTTDKTLNMTSGNPYRLLIRFSIPLLLGNLLQQFYNIVDSAVVGNFVSTQALAAVGTTFPIVFLFTSIFIGIGLGATIIVSQYFGAGNLLCVKRTVDTLYRSMFYASVFIAVVGILISRPMLVLIQTPPDTIDLATTYLQIIFIGTLATFGFNVNSGVLQGLGDSLSPLLYLGIATVVNIILDLVFVLVFGWGVAGVAWATIIAQLVSFGFGIIHINRSGGPFKINLRRLEFDRRLLGDSVRLGLPAGVQNMSFALGTLVLQSLINRYQADFMAGYNGASKIDTFAFLPIFSFATAVTTFVGQNIGANRMDRVKAGIKATLVISSVVCVFLSFLIMLTDRFMMRLFSQDSAVIAAGVAYLERIMPYMILLSILFVLNGALRGTGSTLVPLLATMASLWLVRVPLAYLLADWFGRDNLFYSYPLGWLVGLLIVLPFYWSGRWRNKARVRAATATQNKTCDYGSAPE